MITVIIGPIRLITITTMNIIAWAFAVSNILVNNIVMVAYNCNLLSNTFLNMDCSIIDSTTSYFINIIASSSN